MKSLAELLPLVGVGILAKTEAAAQREAADTKDTLTETDVYLNAARRFVQTHNAVLPERLPLEAAEAAEATAYMEALQDTAAPEFREDIEWRQRRIPVHECSNPV